jgi:hypothetical protein
MDDGLLFGAVADLYHEARPPTPPEALAWLVQGDLADVLDLAAGTGRLTEALLARDRWIPRVHAVEPDTRMLMELEKRCPVPNIEVDKAAFEEKTRLAAREAASMITLTHAAAEQAASRFGVKPSVIPHGFAVSPNLVAQRGDGGRGLLVFGALRPNRDLLGLVRAWRLLPAARLPLRVVLRSLGASDQQRYANELAELADIACVEPDLTVETTARVLSPGELVDRCQQATALVMPYRSITHSGQLELARDLGLGAVVPDVPTVRAQLSETTGNRHPCVWFPTTALNSPIEFARYLESVPEVCNAHVGESNSFAQYRTKEHDKLLDQYGAEYHGSCKRR